MSRPITVLIVIGNDSLRNNNNDSFNNNDNNTSSNKTTQAERLFGFKDKQKLSKKEKKQGI